MTGKSERYGNEMLKIPEHEIYGLYSTLADATEAASTGDMNGCAKLTAQAKRDVMDLHEEYKDD